MDWQEMLAAGRVAEFNAARGVRAKIELFAADLAEASLAGVDLSGADVAKADLSGADLTDAQLLRANLDGIDGTGLKLEGALAHMCKLRDAYLEGAVLTGADFSRSDLAEAMVAGTHGEGLRLTAARLRQIDAKRVVWPDVDLSEARFFQADFSGADLSRADLTDANGAEANLEGARLDGANASGVRLPAARLVNASLAGARLVGASLVGADLTGADLSGADLSGADLTDAIVTNARFRGARLADAVLDGVDLSTADLENADLTGLDADAVGLSEAQRAAVSAVGVQTAEGAVVRLSDVASAAIDDTLAVVWVNADTDEEGSLRWAVLRDGEVRRGVLPVSAASVMAHAVAPRGDDFVIVLVQDRGGQATLVRYPLLASGRLGPLEATPLGYEPAVLPVVRAEPDGVLLFGIAKRGPTLVVHRLHADGDVAVVGSSRVPTAQGLLGRHRPLLVCKGGVGMPVTRDGALAPLPLPDDLETRIATASADDDPVVVWRAQPKSEKDPGGLRMCRLPRRGRPEVTVLTHEAGVASIDMVRDESGPLLAWVESGLLSRSKVKLARLDTGAAQVLDIPGEEEVDDVRFAVCRGGAPLLVCTTLEGGLVALRSDGTPVATIAAPPLDDD